MPPPNHRQLLGVAYRLWEQLVVALGARVSVTQNLRFRGSARTTRAYGWPEHHLNPPSLVRPLQAPVVEGAPPASGHYR